MVLVNFPIVDFVGNNNCIEAIKKISNEYGVRYIDITSEFSSDYSMFYEETHLNSKGKNIFSRIIATKLKK